MTSRVCGGLDSAIAVVSKLMKLSEFSLYQNQLSELNNLLINNKKLVTNEELDFKKQCLLLESDSDLANARKLKVQVELSKSLKECLDLKRQLAQLKKDNELLSDEVKSTEGKYARLYDGIFSELNKKAAEIEELVKERDSVSEECFVLQSRNASLEIEKLDIEDLVKDQDSINEECYMLQSRNALLETEKFGIEDELRKSRDECNRLKEKVRLMLKEKERESSETVRGEEEEERYAKFMEEQLEITKGKDKLIAELSKKVSDMEWREKIRKESNKQECLLLKTTNASATVGKLKLEEELKKSREECVDMKGKLARSREVERVLREKVERVEKIYSKLCGDQAKDIEDLHKRLADVEEERSRFEKMIGKMTDKQVEDSRAVEELKRQHSDVIKDLKNQIVTFEAERLASGHTIEEMRHEKQDTDKTIGEMRRKKLQDDQAAQELRRRNSVASDAIKELTKKILAFEAERLASDRTIEEMRSEQLNTDQIIKKMAYKQLEDIQAADELRQQSSMASDIIEDLKKQILALEADRSDSHRTVEELRHEQLNSEQIIKELRNKQLEDNQRLEKLRSQNSVASDSDVIEELENKISAFEADRLVLDQTVEELRIRNLDASAVIEKLRIRVMALEADKDQMLKEMKRKQLEADQTASDGIIELKGRILAFEAESNSTEQVKRNNKLHGLGTIEDPIEFLDGDDGGTCGQLAHNTDLSAILGQKRKKPELSSPAVLPLTFILRKKVAPSTNSDDNLPNYGQQEQFTTPIQERGRSFHDLSGSLSSHDTGLGTRKLHKTWMSRAEMLNDILEDVEVCMNAVCVLYRQTLSVPESPLGPSGGFSQFEVMGGCELAKYLINGDPENRMRKSVSEVKQERPEVLDKCRTIAVDYGEKLYSIYCTAIDPYF